MDPAGLTAGAAAAQQSIEHYRKEIERCEKNYSIKKENYEKEAKIFCTAERKNKAIFNKKMSNYTDMLVMQDNQMRSFKAVSQNFLFEGVFIFAPLRNHSFISPI